MNSVAVQCDNLTATNCSCNVGYKLSNLSALSCDGRSPSATGVCSVTMVCDQKCINTDGSYYCNCMDGFSLNSDLISCDGKMGNFVEC